MELHLINRVVILTSALLLLVCNINAQEPDGFYVDSTGMIFIKPNTPVFLYMSTSPDGKDAVKLKSIQPEGDPLIWDGHGPKQLNHLDLYLGRKIRFDLFADGKPPLTTITFDSKLGFQKDNKIYISGTCLLEFSSIDANSGVNSIFYSINGSEFQQYQSPIVFENEGEYIITFYAIDNVGNKEDAGERIVILDVSPPVTTLEIDGPKHDKVISSRSKFILSATDLVGVKETLYSIDADPQTTYGNPITTAHLAEGEHVITFQSIDNLGNTEERSTHSFFVDKTPPMVFEEIVGNTYMVAGKEFSSGRSQLRIVAVDNKAGVKEIHYSINNQPFKRYEKPIYLSEITGAVSIRSFAIDNVDNKGISDTEGQQFLMPEVDITGPNISHLFIGKKVSLRDTIWISPLTKVSISANDRGSGLNRIEYKLNDSPNKTYSTPFTVDVLGVNTIDCTAWDNVENINLVTINFGVDGQAPEVHTHFSVKPHGTRIENEENIPVYPSDVVLYIAATDNIVGVEKITTAINSSKERVYSQPLSGFKSGQIHIVTVHVTDKLGNETSETVRFRVE
jgi:hypothetical protein